MIKYIIFSVISFMLGIFAREIIEILERKKKKDDIAYEQLKQAHIQATMELSGGRKTISNRAFRNWNSSIYKYNEKNQSYQLKRGINVGADVPKTIKWK